MANFLKKLFGMDNKRDVSYTGPKPADISTFPSYQSSRDILGSIGGPESYRDIYEKELYDPYKQQAIREMQTSTIPGIEEAFASRGLENSAGRGLATGAVSDAYQNLGTDLATKRGEMRATGLERGYNRQDAALSGYNSLMNAERGQQQNQANFEYNDMNRLNQTAQAQREANQAGMGRALQFGGAIAAPLLSSGLDYLKSLKNMGGGGVSNFGNYYAPSTPVGARDMGNYSKLPSYIKNIK